MKNQSLSYYDLGASLYIPAIHTNLIKSVNREKFENLKSIIVCLEDSILDSQVEESEIKLQNLLLNLKEDRVSIFIRARNFEQFKRILKYTNIEKVDGFVIAKLDLNNIDDYLPYFKEDFYFMPTMETSDIFETAKLIKIRDLLLPFSNSILSIRIGSEDIGNILGIKRDCNTIIYNIPIYSYIISNIISIFKSAQFEVTSPVFSCFKDSETLKREVEIDISNGLFGKTAIHPSQISLIQDLYKISNSDFEEATLILENSESAIFGKNNKMIEIKTHKRWAENIIKRGKVYGFK